MSKDKYPDTVKELWEERVKATPNKIFLAENGKHYTYQDIDELAKKQGERLVNYGVKKGDLVSLQFELDVEDIVNILACIKLDLVINPLNPHFDLDEVKNLVYRFKPYLIITQSAPRGRDTLFGIDSLTDYRIDSYDDCKVFIRDQHETCLASADNEADNPVVILNTSGTTGAPKGVVLTNKNVLSAEYAYNKAFEVNKDDMIAIPSGMYHAIGFHHGLISTIMAGSSMAILRNYSVDNIVNLVKDEPVTFIDSIPTVVYDVLFNAKDLGKLNRLICGGDKIQPALLKQADRRGLPLYNCYGLTEAVPFSYTPRDYFEKQNHMTVAVKPMEDIEIRLVKNGHVITASNMEGSIEVKGPVIFKEYLFNPEKTKSSFDGEWFDTGDNGHYNYDHLLVIDGRESDKIIRGGENISSRAVEEKVSRCDNIKEVAVLGIPDVRLGQRIGAFISLKDKSQTLNKQKLLPELSENNVDKKFWPERIWIVDSLPRTANGKVKKYILKQMVEGKD